MIDVSDHRHVPDIMFFVHNSTDLVNCKVHLEKFTSINAISFVSSMKPAGIFKRKVSFGESRFLRLSEQILPRNETRRMNSIAKIIWECLHSESTYTFTLCK